MSSIIESNFKKEFILETKLAFPPQIAGCQVLTKLSENEFGVVFKGYHSLLETPVVLKLFFKEKSETLTNTFPQINQEIRLLAKLEHEHIARILNAGEENNYYFVVMPYFEEGSLANLLTQQGVLNSALAANYMLQVCSGLETLHRLQIMHRNLTPANLFLDHEGRIKITDFGLINILQKEAALSSSSLFYKSPEQLCSQRIEETSDLFSLGATFYYLITGKIPFYFESKKDIHQRFQVKFSSLKEIAPQIPTTFAAILERLMAEEPAQRYLTIGELTSDLRRYINNETIKIEVPDRFDERNSNQEAKDTSKFDAPSLTEKASKENSPSSVCELHKIPSEISGCTMKNKLGEGGMGLVFKGYHPSLDMDVAIKLLSPKFIHSPEFIERFFGEARALAKLDHENLVRVLNVGQDKDFYFLMMQFIDGKTLRDVLDEEGPIPPDQAVQYMLQVCFGLKEAHKKNIVHRDIKPENLMVESNGRIKITDFGLARNIKRAETLTQDGHIIGSPFYMSPEQCEGKKYIDHRTDIYSLGATFYHLITGRPPFDGDSSLLILMKHLEEEPLALTKVLPEIPVDLNAIIQKMMAKKRTARYLSCEELADDLRAYLARRKPKAAAEYSLKKKKNDKLNKAKELRNKKRKKKKNTELFGEYHLFSEISRGRTGVVYKAFHRRTKRFYALKIFHQDGQKNPEFLARFKRGAKTMAQLEHPNILRVHDFGEEQGQYYFASDFIDGESLKEKKKIPERLAVELMIKIAQAVEYAHQNYIIHRNLKLENILIDSDGEPYLTDFGLAKLYHLGEIRLSKEGLPLGTPAFMSPEQVKGDLDNIDQDSDIFALGGILYFLVTGKLPFYDQTSIALMKKIVHENPLLPRKWNSRLSPGIEKIIMKALEKQKKKRYQSAAQFAEDLKRLLAGEKVLAKAPIFPLLRFLMKPKVTFSLLFTFLLTLLSLLLFKVYQWFPLESNREQEFSHLAPSHSKQDLPQLKIRVRNLMARNRFAEASPYWNIIESLEGESTESLYGLAQCYYSLGNPSQALIYLKRCIKIYPAAHCLLLRGRCFFTLKNYPVAIQEFSEALSAHEEKRFGIILTEKRLVRLYLLRGEAKKILKDTISALSDFKKAKKLAPYLNIEKKIEEISQK